MGRRSRSKHPRHALRPRATIDFESRSACDIKACGSWRYSLDPSTELLCMAFRLSHWEPGRTGLWHPAFPAIGVPELFDMNDMGELTEWIENGGLVEAHGAFFERGMWLNIAMPRHGFPRISDGQWRCSAAKAASHALPRGLDAAALILDADELKDDDGSKVMKKMAKPRKARKAEREQAEESGIPLDVLWFESAALLDRLCTYCRQDVLAEEAVSHSMPDLNDTEAIVYCVDQQMNERGFMLDREGIDAALALLKVETKKLNAELSTVTDGWIEKTTNRKGLQLWAESEGLVLANTQKITVEETLKNGVPPYPSFGALNAKTRRALEIVQTLNRASTAKYVKMLDWMCDDDCAHGGLLYHGASTGRWSGAGIQPQNFPKGKIKDIIKAWELIKTRDPMKIHPFYPNIMELLSWALRGAIIPRPGRQFYVADYASIEARVLPWLAGDDEAVAMFATGADIYSEFAGDIYGYKCNKNDNPDERALGKVGILGLGYQMGWSKFIDSCWLMARIVIDEELSRKTVNAYRERFWRTAQLWSDMEAAAIEAVETGGPVECGKVTWRMSEWEEHEGYQFLYCRLPSGRDLAYPDPQIKIKATPWGEKRPALTYMGVDQKTHQWRRHDSYGGLLVENIDQAVSRDLMAAAAVRCASHEVYTPILTVHDELIAEALLGQGSVHEFEQLTSALPAWATGIPVAAEGWAGLRYRK